MKFKLTKKAPEKFGYYFMKCSAAYDKVKVVQVIPYECLSKADKAEIEHHYDNSNNDFVDGELVVKFFDEDFTTVKILSEEDYDASWSERFTEDDTYETTCPNCGRCTDFDLLVEKDGIKKCIACLDW